MIQWIEKRKCRDIVWSASQEGLLSLNWHFPCHISNFGSPLAWIYLKWGFLGMWNMGPMPMRENSQNNPKIYVVLQGVVGSLGSVKFTMHPCHGIERLTKRRGLSVLDQPVTTQSFILFPFFFFMLLVVILWFLWFMTSRTFRLSYSFVVVPIWIVWTKSNQPLKKLETTCFLIFFLGIFLFTMSHDDGKMLKYQGGILPKS